MPPSPLAEAFRNGCNCARCKPGWVPDSTGVCNVVSGSEGWVLAGAGTAPSAAPSMRMRDVYCRCGMLNRCYCPSPTLCSQLAALSFTARTVPDPVPPELTGVAWLSKDVAVAVGRNSATSVTTSTILRTANAGQTWTHVGVAPKVLLRAVAAAPDGKTAFAVGDRDSSFKSVIFLTSDAGAC